MRRRSIFFLSIVMIIVSVMQIAAWAQPLNDCAPFEVCGNRSATVDEISNDPMKRVATVIIVPPAQFAARDHYVEDTSGGANVAIAWIGNTFRRQLLDKVETGSDPAEIIVYRLRVPTTNRGIFALVGDRPDIGLAHIWALLLHQPAGEEGPLVTEGRANLFLVSDMHGAHFVVDVIWGGAGWEIGATPLDGPIRWRARYQILSR